MLFSQKTTDTIASFPLMLVDSSDKILKLIVYVSFTIENSLFNVEIVTLITNRNNRLGGSDKDICCLILIRESMDTDRNWSVCLKMYLCLFACWQ